MRTGKDHIDAVYRYWATDFGCQPEDFANTCTWVKRQEDMCDTGNSVLYHIGKASILLIDPALAERINLYDGMYSQPIAMTEEDLQGHIGGQYTVSVQYTLLDHFLDPKDFKPVPTPDGFTPRYLDAASEAENALLLNFYDQCSAEDLDQADLHADKPDPVIFTLFDGEQMAAYASHRYLKNTFGDIGVLVHKDYRQRGLGKAVVAELCQYCFDRDFIPKYRAVDFNTGSLRIAKALGFAFLLTVKSLKIEQEKLTAD